MWVYSRIAKMRQRDTEAVRCSRTHNTHTYTHPSYNKLTTHSHTHTRHIDTRHMTQDTHIKQIQLTTGSPRGTRKLTAPLGSICRGRASSRRAGGAVMRALKCHLLVLPRPPIGGEVHVVHTQYLAIQIRSAIAFRSGNAHATAVVNTINEGGVKQNQSHGHQPVPPALKKDIYNPLPVFKK
jgi:hypothetical protein